MQANQTLDQYVHQLTNYYIGYFDVYRDEKIGDTPLAFLARYHRRDERYLMTKTVKIWGVENQQYVYVASRDTALTQKFVAQFEKDLKERVKEDIPQHQEHMSTILLGVIVTNGPVPEELVKGVRKYRKIKFMKFGLHGWAEFYLGIVDLKNESVYIHPKGKSLMEPYEHLFRKKEEQT